MRGKEGRKARKGRLKPGMMEVLRRKGGMKRRGRRRNDVLTMSMIMDWAAPQRAEPKRKTIHANNLIIHGTPKINKHFKG